MIRTESIFKVNNKVLVSNDHKTDKLVSNWLGPAKILEVRTPNYLIQHPDTNRTTTVHGNRNIFALTFRMHRSISMLYLTTVASMTTHRLGNGNVYMEFINPTYLYHSTWILLFSIDTRIARQQLTQINDTLLTTRNLQQTMWRNER